MKKISALIVLAAFLQGCASLGPNVTPGSARRLPESHFEIANLRPLASARRHLQRR